MGRTSSETLCRWGKRFAGLGISELRRLRILEEENRKLKQLAADLSLDKNVLQDVCLVEGLDSTQPFKQSNRPQISCFAMGRYGPAGMDLGMVIKIIEACFG